MLEYCKTILEKVSFNKELFEKELKKSLSFITEEERAGLICWCRSKFGADSSAFEHFSYIICQH